MPSSLSPLSLAALLLAAPLVAQQTRDSSAATETTSRPPSPYTVDASTGIRIVRLSQARGDVQMDRGTAEGFERAFTNLPIVSGARLKTGEGIAEVELEDNSTLRLAPQTSVRFTTLSRDRTTGVTSTQVTVLQGTVFASVVKHDRNPLTLQAGTHTFALTPGSHLRLAVDSVPSRDQPLVHLAVLDGTVQVQAPSGSTNVAKGHGLVFDPSNPEVATLTGKEGKADGLALWDKQSAEFHQASSNLSAFAGNGLYGANDLNYYGSFVNMPGCGSMWRPFFASASWSPFSYGAWAYYPGAGYSFVSPYPWAWTPFHTGAWQQCGNAGWGWSPSADGSWFGLNNASRVSAGASRNPLLRPPTTSLSHHSSYVLVNSAPPAVSTVSAEHTFVFTRDSAGLGVPRQTFGNLREASSLVTQHGSANLPVEYESRGASAGPGHALPGTAFSNVRPVNSGLLSPGVHPTSQPFAGEPSSGFRNPGSAAGGSHLATSPSLGSPHAGGGASAGAGAGAGGHAAK